MQDHRYTRGFRNLIAWQEAHKLTLAIYRITSNFPASETYGLSSQLKRAGASVAAQIVEGSRMPTQKHRKLFYERAYASLAEVDYFLELAHDLNLLNQVSYDALVSHLNRTAFLLHALRAATARTLREASPSVPHVRSVPS